VTITLWFSSGSVHRYLPMGVLWPFLPPQQVPHIISAFRRRRNVATLGTHYGPQSELDSHADDTCCFGQNALVIQETSRTVEVSLLGRVDDVPIATTCVVAYDDPTTYTTYMLIFHEALYIKDLEHNLLCPSQLRFNGLRVNSLLRIFDADRLPRTHTTIEVPAPDALTIPLLVLDGMTSYFPPRRPTMEQFNHSVRWIDMTSSAESTIQAVPQPTKCIVSIAMSLLPLLVISMTCPLPLMTIIFLAFSRGRRGASELSKTSKRKGTLRAEDLAKKWVIGLKQAEKVIKATRQRGVPEISRTFKAQSDSIPQHIS